MDRLCLGFFWLVVGRWSLVVGRWSMQGLSLVVVDVVEGLDAIGVDLRGLDDF